MTGRRCSRSVVASGGYLGFRTWHTKLWWDYLVIRATLDDAPSPR